MYESNDSARNQFATRIMIFHLPDSFDYVVWFTALAFVMVGFKLLVFEKTSLTTKMTKFILWGMVIVGTDSLIIGSILTFQENKFLNEAQITSGQVVSKERQKERFARTTSYYFSNQVEFIFQGEKVRFTHLSDQKRLSFQPGEKVEVYFDPREPTRAEIKGFAFQWLSSVLFFGFGLVLSFLGGWLLFKLRPKPVSLFLGETHSE